MASYNGNLGSPAKAASPLDTPGDEIGGNSKKSVTRLNNIVSTGSALSPVTGPANTRNTPKAAGGMRRKSR